MSQTRREFLQQSALLGLAAAPMSAAAAALLPTPRFRLDDTLRVAKVGVSGMGEADLDTVASHPNVKVVALCDMNLQALDEAAKKPKFKDAAKVQDWRELFTKSAATFDAVVCSTPDHMHAPISMTSILAGKHIYCQKPLARLVFENRQLAKVAKAHPNIVTQMGTQRYAKPERRLGLALLQVGAVGKAKELHGWTDRPAGWWPCGQPRPTGNDAVPSWLGWDLFLGVSPERAFVNDAYTPFKWRGYYDWGTGAIGDMACHIMDVPFKALQLTYPRSVTCECLNATDAEYPTAETIRIVYDPTPMTVSAPFTFTWYDGGRKPDFEALGVPKDIKFANNDGAAIVVGENGTLVLACDGVSPMIYRNGKQVEYEVPQVTGTNHWHDWVNACLGKGKARAPFEFAGLLCETLSLGAISSRWPGKTLNYDSERMTITNNDEASKWIRLPYRKGWEVPNLA